MDYRAGFCQEYTIVVSIFFSIIPIYPQYTIVVSIFFSIIPIYRFEVDMGSHLSFGP